MSDDAELDAIEARNNIALSAKTTPNALWCSALDVPALLRDLRASRQQLADAQTEAVDLFGPTEDATSDQLGFGLHRALFGPRKQLALPVQDADLREEIEPELLARLFHETYERLAPEFGYSTQAASAVPWGDVPDGNKKLMVATATAVLAVLHPEGQ